MRRIEMLAAVAAVLMVGRASAADPVVLVSFGDCANGRCQTGPVQAAAHNVVQYVGGVGQAIVKPLRCAGNRPQPIRNAIRKIFGKCCD